ncbi:bifunctional diaminohydroxyphosphoribosylaminopyrimidine deaminase/5-amino-6-(5-phosphoribosylamino)uracil reductase RibD [Qipengyuania sp. XHP0211]|uniref:bifunctional diaminohydroxyphosphoribosylaminopyrimidine deaminase/5-amino-6-(5-phosphoribosylamino)uracil reductase RibD n=1 Tax=Qipengyuania sp. XHP0211 TaxID=3038079 RepID=UPI00241C5952|nr:bifunctional diaminohydroxyphosphoribosylaminopyrimidine deaminase/5-amino-6-(5-phosphoribosylamino)uracil reductase RibD [Qipengyuania sp. XHP0211]MDG5750499.1 bifunctional diaminohydroxyphosphoribosylaminopyrimidine deaminase/5-amino-6-(5-phosphoribosylamino)uracil reductase RibD [Qipengyuania sp. XHP0211]
MQPEPNDARWLAAAARLASRGRPLSRPNPAVGCVLVKDGRVVGRGWTREGGRPHAEAAALDHAGEAARGATAYVTLEPCAHRSPRGPACADRLIEAGVARVVVGVEDPDPRTASEGIARLSSAGIAATLFPSAEAKASLAGYLTRATKGRPHVTLKLATSLDSCIALADGQSQWITGEAARAHVHSRRALADAILVGGGTWRADKPRLDVRLSGLEHRSPQRILLTRGIPPDGVKVINAPGQIDRLDGVQYLYVEGGAQVAASFLAEDLVDRIELYRAPIMIGAGKHALGDIGLASLDKAHGRWTLVEQRQLGSDTYQAYSRTR